MKNQYKTMRNGYCNNSGNDETIQNSQAEKEGGRNRFRNCSGNPEKKNPRCKRAGKKWK